MKIINLTPHVIRTRSGNEYPTKGTARVTTGFKEIKRLNGEVLYDRDDVLYLPDQEPSVYYIVSAIALAVAKNQGRTDCISPAVFHPGAVRNKWGKIIVVPGFIF